MVFHDFHDFWQKLLQSSQKSSFGGCARPKKRRSSPSGDRKVVSGVIFLSADMFRARMDTHFSWPRPRLEPAGASQSEIPKQPPYLLFSAGKVCALKDYYFFRREKIRLGLGLVQKYPKMPVHRGAAGPKN